MVADDAIPSIISRDERTTPRDGADAIIAAIVASARDAMSRAKLGPRDILAAACSSPGPLDHITGVVHETPNLVGFRDIRLAPEGMVAHERPGIGIVDLDRDITQH